MITRTFVSFPSSANRKDITIRDTLNRIQGENYSIMWSQINENLVNEF